MVHCTNENKIAIIISSIVCIATLTWSLMEFNGQTKATTATKYNPGEFWECLLFVSPTAMLYQLSYEVLLEEGQEQVQFLPLYNETEMMCTPDVPRRRESKKKRYFCKLTEITTVPSFPWSTLECSRGAVVISSASKICRSLYQSRNIRIHRTVDADLLFYMGAQNRKSFMRAKYFAMQIITVWSKKCIQ